MMINRRLINTVPESRKYIAWNVLCQWIALAANITMMAAIAGMLRNLFEGSDPLWQRRLPAGRRLPSAVQALRM